MRTAVETLWSQIGLDRLLGRSAGANGTAFTIAIIALSAKLSKADGVSLRIEAEAFEEIYRVPHSEAPNVKRLFDLAKQDVAGFEVYADRVARLLEKEPALKRDVFEGLFHVATADGVLHEGEERYLRQVAGSFGYTDAEYRRTRSLFVRDAGDPYVVLGIGHDATDQEVKARYRQLVRDNHPDTLVAHGVPDDFMAQATHKLAIINAAYETIARERGL